MKGRFKMDKDKSTPTFDSFDIPLIAFLLTKDHEYISTKRDDSGRVCFSFHSTPQIQSDVFNFSNDALVPSQQFYRNLTKIWRIIKNTNGGGR